MLHGGVRSAAVTATWDRSPACPRRSLQATRRWICHWKRKRHNGQQAAKALLSLRLPFEDSRFASRNLEVLARRTPPRQSRRADNMYLFPAYPSVTHLLIYSFLLLLLSVSASMSLLCDVITLYSTIQCPICPRWIYRHNRYSRRLTICITGVGRGKGSTILL